MQPYLENAGTDDVALERTALRSESMQMRELLAHAASHGTLTYTQLSRGVLKRSTSIYSLTAVALGRPAYVVALPNVCPADTEFAIKALELALHALGPAPQTKRLAKLLAELYFEQQRYAEVEALG